MALLRTEEELNALAAELEERYGKPTKPVQTLLQATKLRLQAQDQHIILISQKRDVLELKWQYPNLLPKANQLDISLRRRIRPVPGNPLMLRVSLANTPDILTLLAELLTTFSKLRKGNPLE